MRFRAISIATISFCVIIATDVEPKSVTRSTFSDYKTLFNSTRNKSTADVQKGINSNRSHQITAVYGITKFSDMSPEEFASKMLLDPQILEPYVSKLHVESSTIYFEEIPKKFDWRDKIKFRKVTNQKYCKACWAVSTVELMESMAKISNKKFNQALSIQELLDCDNYDKGCKGGNPIRAVDYLIDLNMTVIREKDYPTTWVTEKCKARNKPGVKVKPNSKRKCTYINVQKEYEILKMIYNHGPVIVLVNATPWKFYNNGIIHINCDGSELNHTVQIVGYDMTGPMPYYIVRNSWGSDFGIKGYAHIAVGHNVCGIASTVVCFDVEVYNIYK